jgi:phage portal protein BeeE
VAALDSKSDYIPLNNTPTVINYAQMQELRNNVYRYFGVNEDIVMSKYTEAQWNAFYESVIEPIAIQLSLEYTAKLFTDRERGFGSEVVFEANRLQYASVASKLAVIEKLGDRGLLTLNEARDIFNLPALEDGDKRLVSLNYVNADKADQYQLGDKAGKGADDGGDKADEGDA